MLVSCGTTVQEGSESSSIQNTPAIENSLVDETTIETEQTSYLIGERKVGKLKISSNSRMLQYEDNASFFWKGDTAWEMSVDTTQEDVRLYMEDRSEKGFSVIQVSALPIRYSSGNFAQNEDGYFPFSDTVAFKNFNTPNEKYWQHIDYIIETAEKHKLYVALLPTWNGGLRSESEARVYGEFIAKRYKNRDNIIWVVGGDDTKQEENRAIWNALGKTIDRIVGEGQLISYHPPGFTSSTKFFKDASWIDFHMVQSGHCVSQENANELLKRTYEEVNAPVLDAEPRYEAINECFTSDNKEGGREFNAEDVREIAYRQLFSGAFGHTYGHHSVWQKYVEGEESRAGKTPTIEWKDALDAEGARQMVHLGKLMRSRPQLGREPDPRMIESGDAIATRGVGYAFIYLPKGGRVSLYTDRVSKQKIKAWWFNPRTGDAEEIEVFESSGIKHFDTKNKEDMILVLDDVAKGYDAPGQ